MKKNLLLELLESYQNGRCSAWRRGVFTYAYEILESLDYLEEVPEGTTKQELEEILLNGARNWRDYSWGGCSLVYDGDICDRLATPSEQYKKDHGRLAPNSREEWLDCQARALYQASNLIYRVVNIRRF